MISGLTGRLARSKLEVVGDAPRGKTGTTQTFLYDKTIFDQEMSFQFETLVQRFREMAFVTRGVTIKFSDERNDREMSFYFDGGITSFVRYLNRNREKLHPVIHVEKEVENIVIDAAFQYTDAFAESIYAFANTINTHDGGTHLTGLRSAITRRSITMPVLRKYSRILILTFRVMIPGKV